MTLYVSHLIDTQVHRYCYVSVLWVHINRWLKTFIGTHYVFTLYGGRITLFPRNNLRTTWHTMMIFCVLTDLLRGSFLLILGMIEFWPGLLCLKTEIQYGTGGNYAWTLVAGVKVGCSLVKWPPRLGVHPRSTAVTMSALTPGFQSRWCRVVKKESWNELIVLFFTRLLCIRHADRQTFI